MKRLLSVVAIMVLAASLLPVKSFAGLRGAFDPITIGDDLFRGKFSSLLRGFPTGGAGSPTSPRLERWITFVTLSKVFSKESTGEIWLQRNIDQAFLRGLPNVPLKVDLTGAISYIDPDWSKDGRWLLYVQTDNEVSESSIYIQQFDTSTATDGGQALGSPILVADGTGGIHHRHPQFNFTATQVAYDSDAAQLGSIDLWTVDVSLDPIAHTGTVNEASRVRHQLGLEVDDAGRAILNSKAEFKPSYSPDGSKIVYVTNRFGVFQLQFLFPTASGLGESTANVEANPALVTHDNPDFSSNGASLYYDAPASEDPANPQNIWKLDLATGAKCEIFVDLAGDVDPDVSQHTNPTLDGLTFNYFAFTSQAAGFGLQVWRSNFIQTCVPPLPMQVGIFPNQVDVEQDSAQAVDKEYRATLSFPPSTIAAGYVCRAANQPNASGIPEATKEGIRFRRSIINSPTMLGQRTKSSPTTGDCSQNPSNLDVVALAGEPFSCFDAVYYVLGNVGKYDVIYDSTGNNNHVTRVWWNRRTINLRIISLGLVNKFVPLQVDAYSNRVGRTFRGFGFVKLNKKNLAGSLVALEQNAPNPFNPLTKINFAIANPGNVEVRVFNTRGELVRTITNQWYPQGGHTVSWDGKTQSGGRAPSGIYYIRAKSGESTDVIKAVLAK